MLYKLYSRKGNITIVLVGLISVMLIMVAAMSRRMSGHSQLLTLGDYTQISRYFLESYVGDVMQQMRYASNNPKSTFSKEICDSISDADTSKKLSISFYNASDQLITLAHELEIDISKSKPTLEIINTEPLNYPAGIDAGAQNGKEKKGLLQLTCECVFRKREYKLTVQYPFNIVFRSTPILKDFMLFVDNMAKEQKDKDSINILRISSNGLCDSQDLREDFETDIRDIKPFYLLQPLDQKYNKAESNGMVYFGPSEEAIYLNIAGGSSTSKVCETYLISQKDLGINTEEGLIDISLLQKRDCTDLVLPGVRIPLKNKEDTANMAVMGFSDDFENVFNGSAYRAEEFLGEGDEETYWKVMKKSREGVSKAMTYASALKIFGINLNDSDICEKLGDYEITDRKIFGNVFARFLVLTFFQPAQSTQGVPIKYGDGKGDNFSSLTITGKSYSKIVDIVAPKKFIPEDDLPYQFFQSRVMSGSVDWKNNKNNEENNFMALNIDTEKLCHNTYTEEDFDFNHKGGFSLDGSLRFDKFGESWFRVSKNSSEWPSPIEQRIGRAFTSEEEFKKAVGYPERFMINGVVYVKGNLSLDDMNLSSKDCSGGIVLVDGNISLGNIYRGKKIEARNFLFKDSSAIDCFKHWNDSASDEFIGPDKIITFVSLNGNLITLNGNVLLGIQLITLSDHNGYGDQIKWRVDDGIIFYGSIACNRLNLRERLKDFAKANYKAQTYDSKFGAPFFMYPPVMATDTPSLAVQIMENMRGYKLNTGKVFD